MTEKNIMRNENFLSVIFFTSKEWKWKIWSFFFVLNTQSGFAQNGFVCQACGESRRIKLALAWIYKYIKYIFFVQMRHFNFLLLRGYHNILCCYERERNFFHSLLVWNTKKTKTFFLSFANFKSENNFPTQHCCCLLN